MPNLTIDFVSPVSGDILRGSVPWSVTVTAASTFQVRYVEFYINGQLKYTSYVSPYVFNGAGKYLDTFSYPDGECILQCRAYDQFGQAYVSQVSVSIDNSVGIESQEIVFRPILNKGVSKLTIIPKISVLRSGKTQASWNNHQLFVTSDITQETPTWLNITSNSSTGVLYELPEQANINNLGIKCVFFKDETVEKVYFDGFAIRYKE